MEKMADLVKKIEDVEGVEDSALAFIGGLKQQLSEAKAAVENGAPAVSQLQLLIDSLDAHTAPLVAAIQA